MLEAKSFNSAEILAVIDNLKTTGGKKFSKDLLQTYSQNFQGAKKGSYNPSKNLKIKMYLLSVRVLV